jgi:taurine--2-oxoglutarate transaminase
MTAQPKMTGEQLVALTKQHTLYEWSAQSKVDPIPVARAEGIYFYTPEGKRYIDFNSQLMSVNAGHGEQRIIKAITEQLNTLDFANPFMATEPRARLGAKLAELCPGDIDVFFGATAGAVALTGDPRRWITEPGMPGVVRVTDPYHGIQRGWEDTASALANIEEIIQLEGPHTIAAFILETVTGTNGILVPPDGYLQGLREILTRHGILMIADEVMAGFGRTGEWFAVNHWNVVPDLITMAKGLTSSYVPLGAVGMRRAIADHFKDKVFYGGLTYNSHPVGCAAALAAIQVYEEDKLIERAKATGLIMKGLLEELKAKHPSVGAVRSIGLFGIVELVRDRKTMEPMAPFNGASEEMAALGKFFRQEGLYTMVRWNCFYANPPLTITEAQLREAFAIIDRGLALTDKAVRG